MENAKIFDLDNLSLQSLNSDSELIPLMTTEDEEEIEKETLPDTLPILPLRNTVLFPGVVIPITVSRDRSVKLINDANLSDKVVGVVAQKDENKEDPGVEDLYTIGTAARILRVLKMPDGNITVIIQGKKRFEIESIAQETPYIKGHIKVVHDESQNKTDGEFDTIVESIKELAIKIIKNNPNIPSEAAFAIRNIESDTFLINFVSSNMNLSTTEKQKLIETRKLKDRAMETLRYLNLEYQKLELKIDIQSKVRHDLDQQQREYFLHQQMKTIQEELGDNTSENEVLQLKELAQKKKWSEAARKHFDKELTKLQRINPQTAEHSLQRNYLDLYLELPWQTYSKDKLDLKRAQKILDKDHYGLEEVKRRIIEYLAVLKLRNDMKSPILCFYGPPGVGKTSLGKSIAKALGREYARISLGGLRDEAEIRGHRKTYIGAMPGRILQSIRKAGTSNPVFVLDEIDKISSGYNGNDTASAMLEVLDPEQNQEFYDNYLEVGYDLSKVMFIATCNNLYDLHPALRDRMEIIEVSGYTLEEKSQIAKNYLLPKQLQEHGLSKTQVTIEKNQIDKIIEGYTRESGVRSLDKNIAKVLRSIAKSVVLEEDHNKVLTSKDIETILGPAKLERDRYENNNVAGVVTGLAWTSVGGDILFIESILAEGKEGLSITGNLGTVMKESAAIAMQYIKANAELFKINPKLFAHYSVHIHVPEGATPKDGPSAGVALLTSLVSLFTQRKVKKSLAMTGEITLRGKVLPVGGIKEKILAAKRAGIKEVVLCLDNKKDVDEIKSDYLKGLEFHFVKDMSEVIKIAVTDKKAKGAKELVVPEK